MKLNDNEKFPSGSVLFEESQSCDYSDSFIVPLKRSDVASWEPVAAFFQSAPKWIDKLFRLRNRLVNIIGLKTGETDIARLDPPYSKGQQFGLFRIFEITDDEVVLGENDKHLNFKISLIATRGKESELAVSTTVKLNHWIGRVYFFMVKRFHRIIVPVMVKMMAKNIDDRLLPQHSRIAT